MAGLGGQARPESGFSVISWNKDPDCARLQDP
jgi:hypothetical protein